jgi:hypothetical protein
VIAQSGGDGLGEGEAALVDLLVSGHTVS